MAPPEEDGESHQRRGKTTSGRAAPTLKPEKPRIAVFDHTGPSLGGGTLVAAHLASLLSDSFSVDLIRDWSGFSAEQLSSAFSVDISEVKPLNYTGISDSFAVPSNHSISAQLKRSRELTAGYELFICAGHWIPPFCYAHHGIIYCHFPIEVPLSSELAESAHWKQRNAVSRWARYKAYGLAWRARLDGYDLVLANSAFTAGWLKTRWAARTEVVYPPVTLEMTAVDKQNRIVSIGRFDGDNPARKGHLNQVEAFRKFHSTNPQWELWMLGICHSEKDQAYLEQTRERASGLPVRFFVNAERPVVIEALAGAKVFWHTAGLGLSASVDPVAAEHFGVATVEAMRAGCIPIVVSSGGQAEIVQNAVSGFLCRDVTELILNTTKIAENPSLSSTLSRNAFARSQEFSGSVFDTKMLRLVNQVLSARPKSRAVQSLLKLLST